MNKSFAIIKREYLTRVKTKGFIISTVIVPILLIGVLFLPVMLLNTNKETTKQVAVIDITENIYEEFSTRLANVRQNDAGESLYRTTQIQCSASELETKKEELNKAVLNGEFDGYIIFPENIFKNNQFEFYSKNISNLDFNSQVRRAGAEAVSHIRILNSGLDPELVKELNAWVNLETFKIDEKGAKQESSFDQFKLSYFMVFFLYMSLIMYGTFVMRGVIEDKNSRVIETVISSVKPRQFMAGKVIGIGAVGFTQFLIWIAITAVISLYGLQIVQVFNPGVEQMAFPQVPIATLLSFLVYFTLGYFLYATLYAAIGSMCTEESEAQNLQWPVMILIILAFMLMFSVINNPESTSAVVLSLIPFFTPILMFLRISLGAAPAWQVALSIIIMIATIWGSIIVAGRIFRTGILMFGKRATLPEALKWMKEK